MPSFAQGITFTFANDQITGSGPKFFEFDVMVAGDGSITKLGDTQVYINYNSLAFGNSISSNNKVNVDFGSLIPSGSQPFYFPPIVIDNSNSRVSITTEYLLTPNDAFAVSLPNSPTPLWHISIEIADEVQTSDLSFQESLMNGQQTQGNGNIYTSVTANNTLDVTLPVELNSFSATTGDNKVILTWTTQSEVNNLGFEVYRSAEENGEYAMIASYENNESLQGAGNSNAAREYTYEDRMLFNGETYWYQIADVDYQGVRTFHGPVSVESPDLIPEEYALHPNFPNPFNPETSIRFEIPANPANSKVKLVIYNNLGMEVRTLVNGTVEPGIHTVKWDGRNNAGEQIASGVYFLHIQAGTFNRTQKMLLVR